MAISSKILRMQIALFKPFINNCAIETARFGQAKLGELMAGTGKSKVCYSPHIFKNFIGEWVAPKNQIRDGVIIYLHGGGYVAGDIDYAKGFGTVLAAKNGMRVFCAAYRLAPENKFPAAVDDALEAYNYVVKTGYDPKSIILCGESAGGGLIYSLCLKLKELGKELPLGLVGISPWTDLTLSGKTYSTNSEHDPSMTRERLDYYARQYSDEEEYKNPLVSPLFGDVEGFPPSLIFVGGDEIMLDDSIAMHRSLQTAGCRSMLVITPEMWHGYVLYGVAEAKNDHKKITKFIEELFHERV